MALPNVDHIQAQLHRCREVDSLRESIITNLLSTYSDLKKRSERSEDELESLATRINKHSYVFVLIDGDGAPFAERLIQLADGSVAAYQLEKEMRSYIRSTLSHLSRDVRIKVQIFLNVEGLRRKLYATKQLPKDYDYLDFVRQFNMHSHSFNMIDVGPGKEHADHQLRAALDDQIDNPLCKHVILAACHDKGYLPFLRQYQHDVNASSCITLLFTNSTQEEYREMTEFKHIQFPHIFRHDPLPEKAIATPNTSIAARSAAMHMTKAKIPSSPNESSITSNTTPDGEAGTESDDEDTPDTTEADTSGDPLPEPVVSPASKPATPIQKGTAPPAPPSKAPASKPTPSSTLDTKWTAVTTKAKSPQIVDKKPAQPEAPKRFAWLNESYQRIDPSVKKNSGDWETYNSLRRKNGKNFCNSFSIGAGCHESDCAYMHVAPLPAGVRIVLQYMTRRTACTQGMNCWDGNCYLGHICQYGDGCTNPDCKFEDDQHYANRTPYYKVDSDGVMKRLP